MFSYLYIHVINYDVAFLIKFYTLTDFNYFDPKKGIFYFFHVVFL